MANLFGTDGIRGRANTYPMTVELAQAVGKAVAQYFADSSQNASFLIGKDTRISGDMLEQALAAGLASMGADVHLAGVLPTPGIAYMAASESMRAGVVISASHNPYYDNGIKLFGGDGYKLSVETEAVIEELALSEDLARKAEGVDRPGRIHSFGGASDRYVRFLRDKGVDEGNLGGFRLVLDCANGATSKVAEQVFTGLGAQVCMIHHRPDGININAGCGSQHPEDLAKQVVAEKADLGLAFDGDGDRVIVVDEKGRVLTGDQALMICAIHYRQRGRLKNNTVVSTVMSNMGLGLALKNIGIDHRQTAVGDRHVMEEMRTSGAVVGGEDSGHMIFMDRHTTGDGILAGLRLIDALRASGKPLSELAQLMRVLPQCLINVDVASKPELATLNQVQDAIAQIEASLNGQGRVLVRYSGTQPQCRVMVEGPTEEQTRTHCEAIAAAVKAAIGIERS
jgi:phosphoglucosamine mutase